MRVGLVLFVTVAAGAGCGCKCKDPWTMPHYPDPIPDELPANVAFVYPSDELPTLVQGSANIALDIAEESSLGDNDYSRITATNPLDVGSQYTLQTDDGDFTFTVTDEDDVKPGKVSITKAVAEDVDKKCGTGPRLEFQLDSSDAGDDASYVDIEYADNEGFAPVEGRFVASLDGLVLGPGCGEQPYDGAAKGMYFRAHAIDLAGNKGDWSAVVQADEK